MWLVLLLKFEIIFITLTYKLLSCVKLAKNINLDKIISVDYINTLKELKHLVTKVKFHANLQIIHK